MSQTQLSLFDIYLHYDMTLSEKDVIVFSKIQNVIMLEIHQVNVEDWQALQRKTIMIIIRVKCMNELWKVKWPSKDMCEQVNMYLCKYAL